MADSATANEPDAVETHTAIENNLRYALGEDDPREKNYFIRTALQFVEIDSE